MRSILQLVPAALVELLRNAPLSDGKVAFAWRTTVGPTLERVTSVRLQGGVLSVETAGPAWTREIRRASPMILQRLKVLLGEEAVTSVNVSDRRV